MTRDVRGVAGVFGAFERLSRPRGGTSTRGVHASGASRRGRPHRPGRAAATPLSSLRRSELPPATDVLAVPDGRQGPIEPAEVVGSALRATRQALLAWLFEVVEPTFDPPDEPTFDDVPRSHPCFVVVEWAAWEGLLSGYGDGTFRPDSSVPPRAAAAMAARACQLLTASAQPARTLPKS